MAERPVNKSDPNGHSYEGHAGTDISVDGLDNGIDPGSDPDTTDIGQEAADALGDLGDTYSFDDPEDGKTKFSGKNGRANPTASPLDALGGLPGIGKAVLGGVLSNLGKQGAKNADDVTETFRAVSKREHADIMKTGNFRTSPKSLEAKQFGIDANETKNFRDIPSMAKDKVVGVTVDTKTLNKIADRTPVDQSIFRSGTVTIDSKNLGQFNNAIRGIRNVD